MKQHLRRLAGFLAATCVLGVGAAGLATAQQDPVPRAPRDERPIIVEVTGDAANGFGIEHAGGGSYRDLGDLQRSPARVRAPDG